MTLRIHFTAEDLARTRMASGVRPLLELSIGVRLLQERTYPARFDAWRQRAAQHMNPRVRPLFSFIPALGATPQFLDLNGPDVPEDLEQLRSTPARQVSAQLETWLSGHGHVPGAARRLRDTPGLIGRLADAVEYAHEQLIAPYWPRITQLHGADRALRLQQMADHGVDRLLRELNPRRLRWAPPVLHMTTASGRDGDIYLGGRGLLLVPTVFGAHYPAFDHPDEGQPWVTFPVRDGFRSTLAPVALTAGALADVPASLRSLLGRTRATVLCVIAEHPGCTTGQLAAHARISPASASEHASVLRNGGLSTLTRRGKHVLHSPSPAGRALLEAAARA
ncbi:ArsR/SmtB family transcription factor [Streptomyces sp. NPDC017941]|uniref:ArsR/SmtB family transcription factor n=1 Tax=Streptomyces sp. NPDC017941 TaxID=3365018 RepID=UPI0037B51210